MNVDMDKLAAKLREREPQPMVLGGSLFLFPQPVKEAVEVAQEVGTKSYL